MVRYNNILLCGDGAHSLGGGGGGGVEPVPQ